MIYNFGLSVSYCFNTVSGLLICLIVEFTNGPAHNAPSCYQLTTNSLNDRPVFISPNSDIIAVERKERWKQLGKTCTGDLVSGISERIIEHITELGWCLNDPYKYRHFNVPSPETFVDLVARIAIGFRKVNFKFMPTQAAIDDYKAQLINPDPSRGDPGWRFYTKSTFEYFELPTEHPKSRKTVQGLYKKLSKDEDKHCEKAIVTGDPVPPETISWEQFARGTPPYTRVIYAQSPVTSFEDSYNIIIAAHLKSNPKDGEEPHYGRDATFGRVTHSSCMITKDVVFKFVQDCPGCASRTKKCTKARAAGIQTQKRKEEHKYDFESPRKKRTTSDDMSARLTTTSYENEATGYGIMTDYSQMNHNLQNQNNNYLPDVRVATPSTVEQTANTQATIGGSNESISDDYLLRLFQEDIDRMDEIERISAKQALPSQYLPQQFLGGYEGYAYSEKPLSPVNKSNVQTLSSLALPSQGLVSQGFGNSKDYTFWGSNAQPMSSRARSQSMPSLAFPSQSLVSQGFGKSEDYTLRERNAQAMPSLAFPSQNSVPQDSPWQDFEEFMDYFQCQNSPTPTRESNAQALPSSSLGTYPATLLSFEEIFGRDVLPDLVLQQPPPSNPFISGPLQEPSSRGPLLGYSPLRTPTPQDLPQRESSIDKTFSEHSSLEDSPFEASATEYPPRPESPPQDQLVDNPYPWPAYDPDILFHDEGEFDTLVRTMFENDASYGGLPQDGVPLYNL